MTSTSFTKEIPIIRHPCCIAAPPEDANIIFPVDMFLQGNIPVALGAAVDFLAGQQFKALDQGPPGLPGVNNVFDITVIVDLEQRVGIFFRIFF